MLAIVPGLRHQIDALEPLGELAARPLALGAAAIGVAAPIQIDLGKVSSMCSSPPRPSGPEGPPIGARLGAEHPVRRPVAVRSR